MHSSSVSSRTRLAAGRQGERQRHPLLQPADQPRVLAAAQLLRHVVAVLLGDGGTQTLLEAARLNERPVSAAQLQLRSGFLKFVSALRILDTSDQNARFTTAAPHSWRAST